MRKIYKNYIYLISIFVLISCAFIYFNPFYKEVAMKDDKDITIKDNKRFTLEDANIYYENGKHKKALKIYNKIQTKRQLDVPTLLRKGICERKLLSYNKAINTFTLAKKSAESNKKNEYSKEIKWIYMNLGISYFETGDYDKAIKHLEKYKKKENNSAFIQLSSSYLLNSYFEAMEYDKCIKEVDYLLELKKDHDKDYLVFLYETKLDCYLKKENYDKAFTINEKLKEIEPDKLKHYLGTALIYNSTKGYEYTQKYLQGLRKKFPNNKKLESFID
ncbi:tetratricopeptide repeat protein [Dethiothermospora halolimnae]|uniref:tetratricopeptide repeat protein n=1 Tax=Dethiothermospora halolimnae TaxID=3114390 RepID=UPI003CCC152D